MYKTRKKADDAHSQMGAFDVLNNAKRQADAHTGYSVYDASNNRIYPHVTSGEGSTVKLGSASSKVWKQSAIVDTLAVQLAKHGCGSCCTAVALCLKGKSVTPAKVMRKAISLWGKPSGKESYALSCNGIVKILKEYGISAKAYTNVSQSRIKNALLAGKPVICFTRAYDGKDPFASGDHYVIAVGLDKADKVVVANSSGAKRVQTVTLETLCKYVYKNGTGVDKQWLRTSAGSAGYVIVG